MVLDHLARGFGVDSVGIIHQRRMKQSCEIDQSPHQDDQKNESFLPLWGRAGREHFRQWRQRQLLRHERIIICGDPRPGASWR